MAVCDAIRREIMCCLVLSPALRSPLPSPTGAAITAITVVAVVTAVTVTAPTPACDETAVMAGKNALSNDEDKSSTIPKQSVVV